MEKKNIKRLDEVVDINGSKVFIENGEVKTILSEAIQKSGYMTVEEARDILHACVNKLEETYGGDEKIIDIQK